MAVGIDEARRVAIVGAGFAGLAAAVELSTAGIAVDLFEASTTLGGRARTVAIEGLQLDNGSHIMVGAYRETLRLMAMVGVTKALQRHPLHLEIAGAMRIAAPGWLPAPLHLAWALLAARGLSWHEKRAAIGFMNGLKKRNYRLATDITVADLLTGQPGRLRRWLWEPLCLAALNTPIESASAQMFINVLRDSLAADRAASDLLLPACDLGAIFPEPAARYVEAHSGRVHRQTRIATIHRSDEHYFLDDHGPYTQVIIAVAPQHVPKLISGLPELAATVNTIAAFAWQPIVTCYLQYPEPVSLPWAMIGVDAGHAHWLFDLDRLRGFKGTIAAVISGHGNHEELDAETLAMQIDAEVRRIFPSLPLPTWHRVIAEKRATFACVPHMKRPGSRTPLQGLMLAGDYVDGDYPATIEGAVRSGISAALVARDQARAAANTETALS